MPKYPLITFELVIGGGRGETLSKVPKDFDQRATPAEIALLIMEHGAPDASEGEIIQNPRWTGDLEIAERDLKQELGNKYGHQRVHALFPVTLPTICEYEDKREEWAAAAKRSGVILSDLVEDAQHEAAAVAPPEKSMIAQLRDTYKLMTGGQKNASPAWDEATLRQKIAEAALERAD